MSRWKAFGIHFGISLFIVGSIVGFIVLNWYPPGLFHMARADKLLATLALVDVVIGPLLTLIVFSPGKKGLKFDLSMIALMQVIALVYGLWICWQSRPVFLVAVHDRFELVFANEIAPQDLAEGKSAAFRTLGWGGPRIVAAMVPRKSEDKLRAIQEGLAGKDIQLTPRHYVDYAELAPTLVQNAKPLDELSDQFPGTAQALTRAAQALDRDPASLRYVPITSIRGRASMLLDAATGEPIRPVAVDPWPDLAAQPDAK